jgi:hypothetical protein
VGIFDDGNKCRIILYRDQTMGQIPSRIMLRLRKSPKGGDGFGSVHDRSYAAGAAAGRNDGILTETLSFRVHVGGVGVGLKSYNLMASFFLINGLSAGGRPLWDAGFLGACAHTRTIRLRARSASGSRIACESR